MLLFHPVPAMTEELLKKGNLKQDDIDLWVFHQANKYMINYLRKLMCIDKDKFYVTYAGNIGMLQGIETIIEAAAKLQKEHGIR